jgi:hypothetical protein
VSIRFHKFIIVSLTVFFIQKASGQTSALPVITKTPFHLSDFSDSAKWNSTGVFKPGKDLYVKNLGFMCRQEWKIEKTLRIPLRIRMGSLEQSNRLEGK